jgi:hypothetical protein
MDGYNFTERVRKVLAMAREEAVRLHHEYVDTEHLLLGLLREGEGVAAAVLQNLGVDFDTMQQRVEETVRRGETAAATGADLPYSSRAKKVLELAIGQARILSHGYVGTEHLLLGLIREETGIAAQVLTDAGVNLDTAKEETLRLLGTEMPQESIPEATQATRGTTQTQTGKGEKTALRLYCEIAAQRLSQEVRKGSFWRPVVHVRSLGLDLLFWWLLGVFWLVRLEPSFDHEGEGVRILIVSAEGAFLGLLARVLFWAVDQYRATEGLSWAKFLGFEIALGWATLFFFALVLIGVAELFRLAPILIVIGFYTAYVGAGLLVLYVAVRVVRAAWRA